MDVYNKATTQKYSYLLIDLNPHTDKTYQLGTNIPSPPPVPNNISTFMMNEEDRICFVQFLMKATQQQQLYILKTLSKPQLQCILEIIFNVMQGVVSLTEHDKAQLKRRQRFIRAVIATRVTLNQRRKRLLQIKNILTVILQLNL